MYSQYSSYEKELEELKKRQEIIRKLFNKILNDDEQESTMGMISKCLKENERVQTQKYSGSGANIFSNDRSGSGVKVIGGYDGSLSRGNTCNGIVYSFTPSF
jgi:hypothetical protein